MQKFLSVLIFCTLAIACRAARDGFYKVKSSGGYWTRFSVTFQIGDQEVTYNTDKFAAGFSRILEVPKGTTKSKILVENEIWIGVWKTVFEQETESPLNICYDVWGTTLHPSWSVTPVHLCEANSVGSYTVYNSAGYVSKFKVNALIDGSWQTFESGDFSGGMSRTLYVPKEATKNSISIEHYVAAGHPRGFMELSWDSPQSLCFKIWGAIYQPKWAEVEC